LIISKENKIICRKELDLF